MTLRTKNINQPNKTSFYSGKPIALSIMCTSLLLVACGNNGATDRIYTTTDDANATYNLTVRSPVTIKNAKVMLKDVKTGANIAAQQIFNAQTGGNDLVFAVPKAYADNNLIVAEMTPADSTASYYDPTLDSFAPLNKTIHAITKMSNKDIVSKIDPFTEITYQRAIVRSGINDVSKANVSQITAAMLSAAAQETLETFRVTSYSDYSPALYNNKDDYAALALTKSTNYVTFWDQVMAVSHFENQHLQNPSDTTPYLSFMDKAALDMRDGDLDGFTIYGYGNSTAIKLNNPLITADENNDPALNTQVGLKSQNARSNYAALQSTALKTFFAQINSYKPMQADAYTKITTFDMLNGSYLISAKPLHSLGAGNYTAAFGFSTTDATGFKKGVNADDLTLNLTSDIDQIVGTYSNNGCTLDIGNTGIVNLSQNGLTKTLSINREDADTLTRIGAAGTTDYILNIADGQKVPIEYIQLRLSGHTITSAQYGSSSDTRATSLNNVSISCSF